jgi:hypothetical protein
MVSRALLPLVDATPGPKLTLAGVRRIETHGVAAARRESPAAVVRRQDNGRQKVR